MNPPPPPRRVDLRRLAGVVGAVARRPGLWASTLRQAQVLAVPGWWRRKPFLPLPDRDYLHFRLQTAYGGRGDIGSIESDDVVSYLEWCRATRRSLRTRRVARTASGAASLGTASR